MRVLVQIGFMKAGSRRKVGQIVKAYVNDEEISWGNVDYDGMYLTSRADMLKGALWYICELDLDGEDVIKIEAKTAIVGAGPDEGKTFESLYYATPDAQVREVQIPGVGMRGYPLIKGRILEIGSVSEADKRRSEIDQFLKEGFDG